MKLVSEHDEERTVACPDCGAKIGEPCTWKTTVRGRKDGTHLAGTVKEYGYCPARARKVVFGDQASQGQDR